jgi:hypothetical protein
MFNIHSSDDEDEEVHCTKVCTLYFSCKIDIQKGPYNKNNQGYPIPNTIVFVGKLVFVLYNYILLTIPFPVTDILL